MSKWDLGKRCEFATKGVNVWLWQQLAAYTSTKLPDGLTYDSVWSNIISLFDWLAFISTPVKGLTFAWTPESCSRTNWQVSDGRYVVLPSPSVVLTDGTLSDAASFRDGITIVLRSVWTSIVSWWLYVSNTANKNNYVHMHNTEKRRYISC